jgi:peptide deformylase
MSEIKLFPDAVLRVKCQPVVRFDADLARLAEKMQRIMRAQTHGIGIAAPQIGSLKKVALVDVSARVSGAILKVLVNPVILELGAEKTSREGCMSLPDYTANIKRYDFVRLSWQDLKGRFCEGEFTGIEAVCIQHEVDHLNGVLFIDHVVSLKRDLIPRSSKSRS